MKTAQRNNAHGVSSDAPTYFQVDNARIYQNRMSRQGVAVFTDRLRNLQSPDSPKFLKRVNRHYTPTHAKLGSMQVYERFDYSDRSHSTFDMSTTPFSVRLDLVKQTRPVEQLCYHQAYRQRLDTKGFGLPRTQFPKLKLDGRYAPDRVTSLQRKIGLNTTLKRTMNYMTKLLANSPTNRVSPQLSPVAMSSPKRSQSVAPSATAEAYEKDTMDSTITTEGESEMDSQISTFEARLRCISRRKGSIREFYGLPNV